MESVRSDLCPPDGALYVGGEVQVPPPHLLHHLGEMEEEEEEDEEEP